MIATLRNTPVVPASLSRTPIAPRAESLEYLPAIAQRRLWLEASHPNPPASSRRGVSLLEVLIAVFVLTFGLMSVAMVIPAGRALMVDAAKSDRGTACGRAALNDVQVRRWYDSTRWVMKWESSVSTSRFIPARRPGDAGGEGLIYGETYFLDPFFYAYSPNNTRESIRHFPYSGYPWREFVGGSDPRQWPDRALARRITFARPGDSMSASTIYPLPSPLAERLTTWADELVFSLESDNGRPRQSFTCTDGQSWSYPILPADRATLASSDYPLRPTDLGRFKWSVMITPIVPAGTYHGTWTHGGGPPPIPLVDPTQIAQYEISIVVFYNRNLYCPTADPEIRTSPDMDVVHERSVYARLDGGGIGGGDVLLFVPDGDTARPPGYLNVKKNDWIMLKGLDLSRSLGDGTTMAEVIPAVCRWYRVVSVDSIQRGIAINNPASQPIDGTVTIQGRGRYVTLAGPDWQIDTTNDVNDKDASGTYDPDISRFSPLTDIAEAALVDDVIGVYTTIVDVNSL